MSRARVVQKWRGRQEVIRIVQRFKQLKYCTMCEKLEGRQNPAVVTIEVLVGRGTKDDPDALNIEEFNLCPEHYKESGAKPLPKHGHYVSTAARDYKLLKLWSRFRKFG